MKLNNMRYMFSKCTVLEEIKCNGWINESVRGTVLLRYSSTDVTRGSGKLKTDIYMYLASIYIISYYENTDATEPRILDFSGIDTSNLTEMTVYGNTTSIINLHSEIGIDLLLRFASSLTNVENLHFRWSSIGFAYYGGGANQLNIIFETTENSTNYKYENWTSGNLDYVFRFTDTKYTVDTLVSFLECLYDYRAKGESTNASLTLGNNLQRLTSAQKAIATNKGWTLK